MKKILVTGATGHLGRGIVEQLVPRVPAGSVVALARDPSKAASLTALGAEVRQGDYSDKASLVTALAGVDTLMLVSAAAFTDALTFHRNAIEAAVESGVRRVVYTGIQKQAGSSFVMSQVTEWDAYTEKLLKESGLDYTVLKNTMYFDALPFMLGDGVLQQGVRAPGGRASAALASRSDLAEGAAIVLAGPDHNELTYTLGGSQAVTMADITAILSALGTKPLNYTDLSITDFEAERVTPELPTFVVSFLAEWFLAIGAGEFSEVTGDLERLLGRAPATAAEFLPALFVTPPAAPVLS